MKKTLFAFALALTSWGAHAQTETGFKPGAGNSTLEIAPLAASSTGLGLSPLLRYRYFLGTTTALRLGANINSSGTRNEYNVGATRVTETTNRLALDIRPGVEFHGAGSDRLSPYWGAELIISSVGNRFKQEAVAPNGDTETITVTGGTDIGGGERSTFGIGAALVGGADFYFIPRGYFGIEAGIGFIGRRYLEYRQEQSGQPDITRDPGRSTGQVSLAPSAGLRLGFWF